MTLHSSLHIVPVILVVWTDIGHRNNEMHELANVRVLQVVNDMIKENMKWKCVK